MSGQLLAARPENFVGAGPGSSLAIGLDDEESAAAWSVDVYAHLPPLQGPRWVGRVTTSAPAGRPRSRIVAVASVPGASGWRVNFRRLAGPATAAARAELAVSDCCGAAYGVAALDGADAAAALAPASFAAASGAASSLLLVSGLHLARAGAYSPAALAWLQLHDLAAAPVAGAVPIAQRPIAAGAYAEFSFPLYRRFTSGIWVAVSATPETFTPAPGWITAESAP